jgi:hypothetical protein
VEETKMANEVGKDEPRITAEEAAENALAKKKGKWELRDEGHSYDPTFSYRIGGEGPEFQFTMTRIPEESRIWLGGVVERLLQAAYKEGRASQRHDLQKGVAGLLFHLGLDMPRTERGGYLNRPKGEEIISRR